MCLQKVKPFEIYNAIFLRLSEFLISARCSNRVGVSRWMFNHSSEFLFSKRRLGVAMDFSSAHKSNPGTDALPVRTRDLYSECRDIVSSMKFSNFTKSRVDERDSKENIYFSAGKDK